MAKPAGFLALIATSVVLSAGPLRSFAGSRVYAVTPGPFTVNLVCTTSNNRGNTQAGMQTAQLTALFVPN